MDVTIRNLDERVYRAIKAQAAAERTTIAKVIEQTFKGRPKTTKRGRWGAFGNMPSWDFGPGNENLSERIDEILYGDDPP